MASQDSEFSQEKEDLMVDFVEEIKSRPVIWNKQYEGHKDKMLQIKQFESIVNSLKEIYPEPLLHKDNLISIGLSWGRFTFIITIKNSQIECC